MEVGQGGSRRGKGEGLGEERHPRRKWAEGLVEEQGGGAKREPGEG